MPTEKRLKPRTASALKLSIHYTDINGVGRFEHVSAADISPKGCRVTLTCAVALRSQAYLQAPPAVRTSATIRYQRHSPRGYVTGLEFAGGFVLDTTSIQ